MLYERNKINEYTVPNQAAKRNSKWLRGRWWIRRREQHFEAGFGETGSRNGRWMKLGQNCIQWRTLVLTVLNLFDLQKQLMYSAISQLFRTQQKTHLPYFGILNVTYFTKQSSVFRTTRRRFCDDWRKICKHPNVILVTSQWNLNSFDIFSKNTQKLNFINTRPVGTALFCAEGQTDRHDETKSRLSQFCENA
jgi:hypothetical protein